jgi:DNA-binding GntR family transcriptional regulator
METELFSIAPLPYLSKEQAVYDRLRKAIISGTIHPGTRVIPQEIAAQYGVSSMPVRNALMRLEAERLVTRTPHREFLVTQYSASEIKELYAIRAALEGLAGRLGARNMTEEVLRELHQILGRAEQHLVRGEFGALIEANQEFHDRLYRQGGNQQLMELIRALRDRADRYRAVYDAIQEIRDGTVQEHRQILSAMERGDPEGVGSLIASYTERAASVLVRLVESQALEKLAYRESLDSQQST